MIAFISINIESMGTNIDHMVTTKLWTITDDRITKTVRKSRGVLATCSHGGNIYNISKVEWYATDQTITLI